MDGPGIGKPYLTWLSTSKRDNLDRARQRTWRLASAIALSRTDLRGRTHCEALRNETGSRQKGGQTIDECDAAPYSDMAAVDRSGGVCVRRVPGIAVSTAGRCRGEAPAGDDQHRRYGWMPCRGGEAVVRRGRPAVPRRATRSARRRSLLDRVTMGRVPCSYQDIQTLPYESLIDAGERSGQLHPYVRPVMRYLPLAIMGVRLRVRHQSVGRARGTTLLPVLPELYLTTAFPITRVQRFPPDQSGLRPPPTMRQNVTLPRLPRPRHVLSPGRPHCASSTPTRCAPSCSPVPRSPAGPAGVRGPL